MYNKGDRVRVKGSSDIYGQIEHRRFTDDGESVEYKITWPDEDGGTHERYFQEHQLVPDDGVPLNEDQQ